MKDLIMKVFQYIFKYEPQSQDEGNFVLKILDVVLKN